MQRIIKDDIGRDVAIECTKFFGIPWGSENVCYWCKERYCQQIETLIENNKQYMQYCQIIYCPFNSFKPDYSVHPSTIGTKCIVERIKL